MVVEYAWYPLTSWPIPNRSQFDFESMLTTTFIQHLLFWSIARSIGSLSYIHITLADQRSLLVNFHMSPLLQPSRHHFICFWARAFVTMAEVLVSRKCGYHILYYQLYVKICFIFIYIKILYIEFTLNLDIKYNLNMMLEVF